MDKQTQGAIITQQCECCRIWTNQEDLPEARVKAVYDCLFEMLSTMGLEMDDKVSNGVDK